MKKKIHNSIFSLLVISSFHLSFSKLIWTRFNSLELKMAAVGIRKKKSHFRRLINICILKQNTFHLFFFSFCFYSFIILTHLFHFISFRFILLFKVISKGFSLKEIFIILEQKNKKTLFHAPQPVSPFSVLLKQKQKKTTTRNIFQWLGSR